MVLLCACGGDTTPKIDAPPRTTAPPSKANHSQSTNNPTPSPSPSPDRSCRDNEALIQTTPSSLSDYANAGFNRYIELSTSRGKPIHIFAQDAVSDAAMLRAHNILKFYLEDVPGSAYGANKAAVFDKMGDHQATLLMPNGAHGDGAEPRLRGQLLYQNEITVEGSDWYIQNNYEHRDATFEEIFHLVHDDGIGTDRPGALPAYQDELLAEARRALADNRWGIAADPSVADWIAELDAEGSIAQEYIAAVIDSYYGLWGPWTEAEGGMWGIYIAKTRAEVLEKDPKGAELLSAFLPDMLGYDARIDPSFTGTFEMAFRSDLPYTHKSRYLLNAMLTGDKASHLLGNAANNRLSGNSADNTINGAGGEDTVIYCHPKDAYTLDKQGNTITLSGPDGTDTLLNIEHIHFADQRSSIDEL